MAIIVVTHELRSAFQIADRLCMLDRGKILAVGTVDEIMAHPHPRINQFVNRVPDDYSEESPSYITGF